MPCNSKLNATESTGYRACVSGAGVSRGTRKYCVSGAAIFCPFLFFFG